MHNPYVVDFETGVSIGTTVTQTLNCMVGYKVSEIRVDKIVTTGLQWRNTADSLMYYGFPREWPGDEEALVTMDFTHVQHHHMIGTNKDRCIPIKTMQVDRAKLQVEGGDPKLFLKVVPGGIARKAPVDAHIETPVAAPETVQDEAIPAETAV